MLNAPTDVQAEEYDGDIDEYQTFSTLLPRVQRVQPDPELVRETAHVTADARNLSSWSARARPHPVPAMRSRDWGTASERYWRQPCR